MKENQGEIPTKIAKHGQSNQKYQSDSKTFFWIKHIEHSMLHFFVAFYVITAEKYFYPTWHNFMTL